MVLKVRQVLNLSCSRPITNFVRLEVAKLAFGGPLERHCCHVSKVPELSLRFLSIILEDVDGYEGTKCWTNIVSSLLLLGL